MTASRFHKSCRDYIPKAVLLLVWSTVLNRALSLHAAVRSAHIVAALEGIDLKLQLIVALLHDHVCFLDIAVLNLDLLKHCASVVVLAQLVALNQRAIQELR